MIEFKESQKMAKNSSLLSYAVRIVKLTEDQSFIIHPREDRTPYEIKKYLEFYRINRAREGGEHLDFSVDVLDSKSIRITGNLRDAVTALQDSKLISQTTKNEICDNHQYQEYTSSGEEYVSGRVI